MAQESDQGEKTEEPTQQRREDFRKRGQVTQTKELGTVLLLFASVLAMWLLGQFFMKQLVEIFSSSFSEYVVRAVRDGDLILVTRGETMGSSGGTNTMSIVRVGGDLDQYVDPSLIAGGPEPQPHSE